MGGWRAGEAGVCRLWRMVDGLGSDGARRVEHRTPPQSFGEAFRNAWPSCSRFDTRITMTQAALTRSLKQALAAGLREHRDEFGDLLAEVIEDVALVSAIREGEKTKPVKRETVMKALRGGK